MMLPCRIHIIDEYPAPREAIHGVIVPEGASLNHLIAVQLHDLFGERWAVEESWGGQREARETIGKPGREF